MPYITQERRKEVDGNPVLVWTKGDLEYKIFKLLLTFINQRDPDNACTYHPLHDAVYAAIHVGEEFKRRFLDIREDLALKSNGDIYID